MFINNEEEEEMFSRLGPQCSNKMCLIVSPNFFPFELFSLAHVIIAVLH